MSAHTLTEAVSVKEMVTDDERALQLVPLHLFLWLRHAVLTHTPFIIPQERRLDDFEIDFIVEGKGTPRPPVHLYTQATTATAPHCTHKTKQR